MLPTKESELATFAPIAPVGEPPRAKYERLIVTAKAVPPATTVVVHPCDETSLRGAVDAAEAGNCCLASTRARSMSAWRMAY